MKAINARQANTITLALWAIALGSHLILIPMLIRELYQDFFKGQKTENRLFR